MDIRRQRLLCIGIIVIAIWSVFGRTLWYGMIDLDDQEHLIANLAVSRPSWSGLLSIWREPYFKLYIPMTYTGWAGISALALKLNQIVPISTVALYHMANVLCHTVSCLILFTILRRRTHSALASCLGALFFALHPLQVESIAWLSGFKDAFSGMLSIASIFFLLAYSESNRLALGMWSVTFYAAALLAKPTSVLTPLLGAVLILPEVYKLARTRLTAVLGLELFFGGLLVLYTRTIQPAADLPFTAQLWERPMLAADALLFYAAKVVAPIKLGFDYGMDPEWAKTHHPIFLALAVVAGSGLLLAFCSSWRRLRTPAALFVFGLLPTLGLVSYYYQAISTTADRYVYLAMMGPAFFVAQSVAVYRGRWWFPLLSGACGCLVIAYGALSVAQVHKWQSTTVIARHTLEVNPRSWLAHHVLGGALIKSGDLAGGALHLKQTNAMRPWFPDAYYNLGIVAKMTGDLEGAVTNFRATVRYEPKDSRAWHELAASLATLGRFDQASEAFEKALTLEPTSGEILGEYGRLKISQGDMGRGVLLLEKAVRVGNTHPAIHAAWGEGLLRLGKDEESLVQLNQAMHSGYGEASFLANYGLVHMRLGHLNAAVSALEEAVARDPQGLIAWYNLGLAYKKKGEREKAREALSKALEIKKDFVPAQKALE